MLKKSMLGLALTLCLLPFTFDLTAKQRQSPAPVSPTPEAKEKLPKFRPVECGIAGMWRIEFEKPVTADEVGKLAAEMVGARNVVRTFDHWPARCAAWVRCDEATARRISEDARVNHVQQDEYAKGLLLTPKQRKVENQ